MGCSRKAAPYVLYRETDMERWKIVIYDGLDYTVCPHCDYMYNNDYFFEPYRFRHCPNCGERLDVAEEYDGEEILIYAE